MSDVSTKLLDEALLAKIKSIQMRAKHLVNDVFAGEYLSAFKGRGMEFEEVREYLVGDDVRNIDWNVTARQDKAFIKTYRDERELTVMFIVDVSGSSKFGTVDKFKNEVASEIAALLSYTALKNNDKIGLIVFSDHVEHYVAPKKGRGHIWRLISDILSYRSESKKTDINVPLEFLNRVLKKKAIVFLISDFQSENFEKEIQITSRRHDLIALSITDPREISIPPIGYIELEDAETGEYIMVNSSDENFQKEFSDQAKKRVKATQTFFRKYGIDLIEVDTEHAYIDPIIRFFKRREKVK